MVTIISRLSTARGVARSRVWLEGPRLDAAGFRHGAAYHAVFTTGQLAIVLGKPKDENAGHRVRYVAGAKDRPIIDITGEIVRETFGANPCVRVTFKAGRIMVDATQEVRS